MKIFRRAEIFVPTWQGWTIILCIPILAISMYVSFAYSFFHTNAPIGRDYLVVEGWMDRTELKTAVDHFRSGDYRELIVTGGPIQQDSYWSLHYPHLSSRAEIGASQIRSFGISPVYAISRPAAIRDRTYTSALALRKWLKETGRTPAMVDIVSSGAHSRRSLMLFEIALANVASVGVIATVPVGYNSMNWWRTSMGVRAIVGESIAYAYAKFLFYPNPAEDVRNLYENNNGEPPRASQMGTGEYR